MSAQDEGQGEVALSVEGAEKLVVGLEKKINDNIRQRMKYSDPAQFMGSEVELDEHIKSLHVLATAPKLYPRLVKVDFVRTLLGLVIHENTDISVDTLHLISDLVDPENLVEAEEESREFIESLTSSELKGMEIVVQNLFRLNEKEEADAQGIYYTLNIIENMVEHDPLVVEPLFTETKLLEYLLQRIKQKELDQNKLYSSEILSIMLQTSSKNQLYLGNATEVDGIDSLLVALSKYRKRDAASTEEEEYVANMFEALCSALMVVENQKKFCDLEGLELMLRMIKERRVAYPFAVRTIQYALERNVSACTRFVTHGGLKTLFPLFMGRGLKRKRLEASKHKGEVDTQAVQDSAIAILSSLITCLPTSGTEYVRVCKKFAVDDVEKTDRLVELHYNYSRRLRSNLPKSENQLAVAEHLSSGLSKREALYLVRLTIGLEGLQRTSCIMSHLICSIPGLYEHIEKQFKQTTTVEVDTLCKVDGIASIVKEYSDTLLVKENEDSPLAVHKDTQQLKSRLSDLVEILTK